MAGLTFCGKGTSANTGSIPCDFNKGILDRPLIFNGAISAAEAPTPEALFNKLVEYSKLSKGDPNKVFPLMQAQEITDQTEADTTGSLGLGYTQVLVEGKPAYEVKMFAGSAAFRQLRKWDNQIIRLVEIDKNKTIWGTKSSNNFVGYQARLKFSGNKLATGQAVEEGVVTCTISIIDTAEYFDNFVAERFTGNVGDIVGLVDVTPRVISNVDNVYKIALEVEGVSFVSKYNIFDAQGLLIAGLGSNFSAISGTTPIPVTSVAADTALKALTVTYDSVAYTGLSSGATIRTVFPTVAQLDAADATGVEIEDLVHIKS